MASLSFSLTKSADCLKRFASGKSSKLRKVCISKSGAGMEKFSEIAERRTEESRGTAVQPYFCTLVTEDMASLKT